MAVSSSSKILRAVLFALVPTAYLSMGLWRPFDLLAPSGREWDAWGPTLAGLLAAVFVVSLLAWKSCRIVATLGLLVCLLWVCVASFPVL
jgi:hypothetical protein